MRLRCGDAVGARGGRGLLWRVTEAAKIVNGTALRVSWRPRERGSLLLMDRCPAGGRGKLSQNFCARRSTALHAWAPTSTSASSCRRRRAGVSRAGIRLCHSVAKQAGARNRVGVRKADRPPWGGGGLRCVVCGAAVAWQGSGIRIGPLAVIGRRPRGMPRPPPPPPPPGPAPPAVTRVASALYCHACSSGRYGGGAPGRWC